MFCVSKVELLREMAAGWKSHGASSGDAIPDPNSLQPQELKPGLEALKPDP